MYCTCLKMWFNYIIFVWCLLLHSTESLPNTMTDNEDLFTTDVMSPTTPAEVTTSEMMQDNMAQGMMKKMTDDDESNKVTSSICTSKPASLVSAEMQCEMKYEMLHANLTGVQDMSSSGEKTENSETIKLKMMLMHSCSYHCILQQLGLLSDSGLPNQVKMNTWVMNNTMEPQTKELLEKLPRCFMQMITTNASSEMKDVKDVMSHGKINAPMKEDTACPAAMSIITCLDKNQKCPLFKIDSEA